MTESGFELRFVLAEPEAESKVIAQRQEYISIKVETPAQI